MNPGFSLVSSNDYKEVGLIDSTAIEITQKAVQEITNYYITYYRRFPTKLELEKLFEQANYVVRHNKGIN